MPEESRVFDVSKPGRATAQATSKPVIVGHHPAVSDPMMRTEDNPSSIPITVHDSDVDTGPAPEPELPPFEPETPVMTAPEEVSQPAADAWGSAAEPEAPKADNDSVFPSEDPAPAPLDMSSIEPELGNNQPGHVQELHMASAKKRRNPMMLMLLVVLLLLVGAYLFVDSGVVDTGINLPVHVFKQKAKTPVVAPTTTPSPSQAQAVVAPAGFTEYKLKGTSVTFAAPTAWGTAESNADLGYSVRGGTNKTDGTYAYLVEFTTNKDVEIALTSSKYLPAARGATYYDFLQWCTGTNDNKIYQSVLHFTTAADKTDTPATVACDIGPLTDATKLDSTTIVQLNTKSADGKTTIGDLYTKNLKSSDLVVFRVKDAKSANAADIKKLLLTVKSPSGSAVTTTQ